MLKQRFFTAIIALIVLGVVLFVLPEPLARVMIVAVIAAGAWEWGGFLGAGSANQRWSFVAFIVALIAVIYLVSANPATARQVLMLGLGWWVLATAWLFFYPTAIPQGLKWIGGALVLVPAWTALDWLYRLDPEMLLFALVIVWIADMGAYFVGKRVGRVKLAPSVSPGKTWEGVFGGLASVALLTVGAANLFSVSWMTLLPFSLAVAVISVVGDLTVSMFKRNAGVKDSGALFPGHGGVLDRIDSVAAAAPLFVIMLAWTGLS